MPGFQPYSPPLFRETRESRPSGLRETCRQPGMARRVVWPEDLEITVDPGFAGRCRQKL
jgi:hypothetical protein